MKTTRRQLLRGSALLAAGAVLEAPFRSVANPALISAHGLGALARDLTGRLILPGERGFVQAALPNNTRFAEIFPRAVAMCATDADLRLCVKWARDNRTPFAVRSGGHNYAGFSCTQGLLIDVRAMNAVAVDTKNGLLHAQAGVNNAIMADALRNTNFAVPAGRCLTVGVAGLTLGGGWGFTATRAGLTCDSLRASGVVLADGRKIIADERSNADLFWGLRGGGGGNFGVNTSFTYRLTDVGGPVTAFNIFWPATKFVALLSALQEVESLNVRRMSMRLSLGQKRAGANPAPDDLLVECQGQFFGTKQMLQAALAPVTAIAAPASAKFQEGGFWQAADFLAEPGLPHIYNSRSAYVGESLSPDGLEMMLRLAMKWPGGAVTQTGLGKLFAVGGKVRDIRADATAYVHRNANYIFEVELANDPSEPDSVVARQNAWFRNYFVAMQPFLLPQSYVNFPTPDLDGWAQRYYGSNLGRLSQVKRRYDPDNIFRFAQSIPGNHGS